MSEAIMIGFAATAALVLYLIKIRLDWINDLIRSRDTQLIPLEGKIDEMRRLLDMQASDLRMIERQLDLVDSGLDTELDLIKGRLELIDARLDKLGI